MKLKLGPLTIALTGLAEQDIPANSRLFLLPTDDTTEASKHYAFHFVDRLPLPTDDWTVVFRRTDIVIFQRGTLEARLLAIGNLNACYALYQERNEQEADIYFVEALKGELQIDTVFVSCLCLERPLWQRGCYILHCAFLDYRRQGILFSGPSGIGKSTHSNLWCQHIEQTQVLNGDRALICPTPEGGYEAVGWPVCGSSEICFNEKRTLHAIVFMEQATDNAIRPMTPMQHFKLLSSQVTINWWNKRFARESLDQLLTLSNQIPIRTYACNLLPEAAYTLRQYLTVQGIVR